MDISRRSFIATSLAGAVMAYATRTGFSQAAPAPDAGMPDEDGSQLWLRYAPPPNAASYSIQQVVVEGMGEKGQSPTLSIIDTEINSALFGMFKRKAGEDAFILDGKTEINADAVVVGTPKTSPTIRGMNLNADLDKVGPEGYLIRSTTINGKHVSVIASNTEIGALYGTYHFLRLIATGQPIDKLDLAEKPAMKIRMADHWDNVNGTQERGYGGPPPDYQGRSIYFSADARTGALAWNNPNWKPGPLCEQYARAAASLGMNGICINNVNATAAMLTADSLKKVAMLADTFRPYGLRVYVSANFGAPTTIGGMQTADPIDEGVQKWWKDKADEIYKLIPDFGGMLVKADSEGQPGPKKYGRTHAEGANCLADAFAPHNGIVIWRAFVYDPEVDPDRVKRAYIEFMKLDGKFRPNVLVQIKNGPLDFQPREPVSPLFGALTKTSIMAEIQPTQEYLGQARHLVYLGTMWEEFLQFDTYAKGKGSTVANCLEGKVQDYAMTGTAGVLNPGSNLPNWTGHHFCQANWFALGRLCWNPQASAQSIAEEWTKLTFTHDPAVVKTIVDMMMGSRETFLNYTMPLGLHHLIGGDHYAPQPWNGQASRPDWTATYYHHAAADGIGFERTRKGDGYVDQYFKPVADMFDSLETCPDKYLLWFHHVAWDYKMKSGKTLWTELCEHYQKGVKDALAMQATWASLAGKIDAQRHREVAERLQIQVTDAAQWRDRILQYWQSFSKMDIPTAG